MTGVSMVGFTHRASVLRVLERVSVPRAAVDDLLRAVRAAGFPEAVVLSTCSRTQIYAGPSAEDPSRLLDLLVDRAGGWTPELRRAAETRVGDAAVEHLFRVTAGLDSRVVGEPEIRTQVRAAFRQACAAGMTRGTLGELFSTALRAGAEVRRKTSVVSQARSLAHRAVEVGVATTGRTGALDVVVLGSGRMAAAAVDHLRLLGHHPVVVARSEDHAARLVGAAAARPLPELATEIGGADLLISATAASQALVTVDDVAVATAGRRRPLTVVDLSVPRNVDPAVGRLDVVRLVDIEDMSTDPATEPGLGEALVHAESLVRESARRYAEHVAARRAGPLITAMRRRVEEVCRETLARTSPADDAELATQAHRLAGRLTHPATMAARAAAAAGDEATLMVLCEAFGVPWAAGPSPTRGAQSLTTTYDAAVELIRGLTSQPGGVIGRSSGAEMRTTTRSAVASTANCRPG